jgi:hypothetical protein
MMTLEKLEQYCGILAETEAIKAEIKQLYNPVKSPNGKQGGGSSTPSSPTETNAMRIILLKDQLATREKMLDKRRDEIETWVATIEDAEVAAIVRWRYIIKPPRGYRYTWAQVNLKVYGYKDYQYSFKKLKRFLENCTKSTNQIR